MSDIIVTTPIKSIGDAELEALKCIKEGGGFYFRVLSTIPKNLNNKSRIFYVEDGYIRGFSKIHAIRYEDKETRPIMVCETTDKSYRGAVCLFMDSKDWTWIRPIRKRGFQGWRYFVPPDDMEVVGNWLDPKPEVKK